MVPGGHELYPPLIEQQNSVYPSRHRAPGGHSAIRWYAVPGRPAYVHPATATAEPAIALRTRNPRRVVRDERKPLAASTSQLLRATPLLGRGGDESMSSSGIRHAPVARAASARGSTVRAMNVRYTPTDASSTNGTPASGCAASTSGRPTPGSTTTAPATTIASAFTVTCTALGGVSTLPKHPHELSGAWRASATTTNTRNTTYESPTSTANARLPNASAPAAMTSSAAAPTRTSEREPRTPITPRA